MSLPKLLLRVLLFLLLLPGSARSQENAFPPAVELDKIRLVLELRPFVSVSFTGKDTDPRKVYSNLTFSKGIRFTGPVPDKYVVKKALLRFSAVNHADTSITVYFFPGFYYPFVKLYRDDHGVLQPLPEIVPSNSQRMSYRGFTVPPHDSMTVIVELHFLKTYSNKIRPRLVHPDFLDAFIFSIRSTNSESDLATYIFCGLLLMMILYSLAHFLQGGHREFLYYSLYAFLLGSMLFTKAIFNYRSDSINFFLEEYLDFILQCLGIICYMFFMQRFLVTKENYRFLQRLYQSGILMLFFSIVIYTWFHYATDNFPLENLTENLTKILLLGMVIGFLAFSVRHWKDHSLRYLFWGNLLFLLFSIFSLALILIPHLFNLGGLAGNSLLYYEAGLFFELVFFMAALNNKNRSRIVEETREREYLRSQNLVKEYEKEMAVYKAQQEERERISADMHDELGSGITAIRLMSEIARNKMKEDTPVELHKISHSANDVLNKMNAIIWSMNASNDSVDNLLLYIRTYAVEYFENTPVTCQVESPDKVASHEITGEKRRNIFLSVKESLNNILKHAAATKVNINIIANGELVIIITDDGKGIDLDKLRYFGNGLKNMARRMENIGGSYQIENTGGGSKTTLRLPL
jgi:signal transduction histidine kinase